MNIKPLQIISLKTDKNSNDKYSPEIKNAALDAVNKLLQSQLPENLQISILGHTVKVGDATFWFQPGKEKLIFRVEADKVTEQLFKDQNDVAKSVRFAINSLKKHAAHLGQIKDFDSSYEFAWTNLLEEATASQSKVTFNPIAETTRKCSYTAILVFFGALKGLDLSPYFLSASQYLSAFHVISSCTAALQLVTGALSLIFGTIELVQGIKQSHLAESANDKDGALIAKERIAYGIIYLLEGVFWITLGILCITCPHLALALGTLGLLYSIMQYSFTALFVVDSAMSLAIALKRLHSVEKYRSRFELEILKNPNLPLEDKPAAARRFIEDLLMVSEAEQNKMAEKWKESEDTRLTLEERQNLKWVKKRLIAQRLGISADLLNEKDATLLEKVTNCFDGLFITENDSSFRAKLEGCLNKNVVTQKFSKYSSVVCLAGSLLSIPIPLILKSLK